MRRNLFQQQNGDHDKIIAIYCWNCARTVSTLFERARNWNRFHHGGDRNFLGHLATTRLKAGAMSRRYPTWCGGRLNCYNIIRVVICSSSMPRGCGKLPKEIMPRKLYRKRLSLIEP